MKKTIRIITAVLLSILLLVFSAWYLMVYDREFTRDMLLGCARHLDNNGDHNIAAWFYNLAYNQSDNGDSVAIELAQQYKAYGNFTKAEYTLYKAIANGGGLDVYIALSKLYVEQDKLLDAVTMLGGITNPEIKEQLDAMRPKAPTSTPDPGFYNQYISVTLRAETGTIYYSAGKEYPSTLTPQYTDPITLGDGENTIQAIAVSDDGLVSPLSIFGYTVGGVIELVEFDDTNIESAVRTALSASDNQTLFSNDLWNIKEFTIPDSATNYQDIEHMIFLEKLTIQSGETDELKYLSGLTALEELHITDTTVSQEALEWIAALPGLKKLTLSGCRLSGIAPLSKASGITYLDISNNTIRNLDAITAMPGLSELYLQHNAVDSLSALSGNTNLKKLNVSHNSITSLAPITNLTLLTQLDAGANLLNELGNIGQLTAVTELILSGNKLTALSTLNDCTAIVKLDISSNALTDISSLSTLTNMQYFDFSHNEVTDLPKWSKSCALVTINGSYNKLSKLDNLGGLKQLNIVSMDYNEGIRSVSALADCPMLIEVNVYGTKVSDVRDLTSQSIVVNYNPVN